MRVGTYDGLRAGERKFSNSCPARRMADFRGLPIRIEIEAGEVKSGVDEAGRAWSHEYRVPYGEILKTSSLADGDPVDVYLGPDQLAPTVYVVHQMKMGGKQYDEDKVFLGFANEAEAILNYKLHGPQWGFGSIDSMNFKEFRDGYLAANRRHQ